MDDFIEFSFTKLIMPAFTVMTLLMLFIGIPCVAYAIWNEETHHCKAYGEPYYHEPYYIQSGKVMVPVNGGVWSDCVSR